MVRGQANDRTQEIVWDPPNRQIDVGGFVGVDGVVHLAGENIAEGRWTTAKKGRIRDSRIEGTRLLAETLSSLDQPPSVLVSASAIGYYGDRGSATVTEESPSGSGYLADVCRDWEAATESARESGIRVVQLRIGVVLSRHGGALAKMLTPFKLGLGGVIGSGEQYMSWIEIDDLIRAIEFSLATSSLQGPVNAVAPGAVTNREFTKTLGRILKRPTLFPMPAVAARLALGEMADHLLLTGARVEPKRLIKSGFQFQFPGLQDALCHVVGKK